MVLITILFLVIIIIISILPLMSDGSKKFYFLLQNHMALYKGSVKVSGSAGAGFDPQNAGTTGQVLTKTATGYNWDDATGSIESSNDTYDNIIYLSQAEYDNLSSYEPNTLYSTPDGGDLGYSLTVTLTSVGWDSNEQTVTATGVTSSNTVIVSPTPASMEDYVEGKVLCIAQGTNSLTFTCDTEPSNDITVNIAILF